MRNLIFLMAVNLLVLSTVWGEEKVPTVSPAVLKTALVPSKIKSPEVEIKQTIPSIVTDKPVYYTQCNSTPLRLGEEDYQKSYLALRGLTGVYVNIDDVIKGAEGKNVKIMAGLKEEVVSRLNKAGIRLLTEEEMEKTLGQPQMSIFPSFPKHLGPFKKGEAVIEYHANCCTEGIWTSFTQGAKTLRDPFTNYKLGTWGEGNNTNDCSDIGGWMSGAVLQTIDDFVSDKQKAQKDYDDMLKAGKIKLQEVKSANSDAPKGSLPAETGNMSCNTSLMMYIEMFKTNATDIMPSKYYVLNKLADAMKACPRYQYLIETHADKRSTHAYNYRLSSLRAKSIRYYLIAQGVAGDQFDIQPFGDTKPVTNGTSDEDYAANRRVVVTPYVSSKK